MFNFSLSNFYNGHIINRIFLDIASNDRKILKDTIYFNQITGTFPFNSWCGGLNSCLDGNISLYEEIAQCFNNYEKSLRLDFSNIFLEEEDFYNNYNRIMLEHGRAGSTVIEVSNLKLYEYIKEHYPTYNKFVLSSNAWSLMDLTPEMVNTILENQDFQLVSLPPAVAEDVEFLQQIKAKNKIEICVNPLCPLMCKEYNNCVLIENQAQYNYSINSVMSQCGRRFVYSKNKQTKNLEDLKSFYFPLGITHFKLATCQTTQMIDYFIFLINYFIKPEYQQKILEDNLNLIIREAKR